MKRNTAKNVKIRIVLLSLLYIFFAAYLLLLLKIVLFKYRSLSQVAGSIISGDIRGFHSLNLIPFRTIIVFVRLALKGEFMRGFANIAGNICIFAPLGYFLPLLFKKFRNPRRVLLLALFLSCVFEILQYFLRLGSADIDDVLLNFIGAALGFIFYRIIVSQTKKHRLDVYKITALLSVICFLAGGMIAVKHFGIFFGISGGNSNNRPAEGGNVWMDIRDDILTDEIDEDTSELMGTVKYFTEEGFIINLTTVTELENGISIAESQEGETMRLIRIRLLPDTVYRKKTSYDMYGDRVEWENITRADLKAERTVQISGYEEDGIFVASEVIMNIFVFME